MDRVLLFFEGLSCRLDILSRWIAVPTTLFFLILIFLSVAARFIFKMPFVTSEELCRIGFVWACMMGAAICVRNGSHIRFEFTIERLSPRIRYGAEIIIWSLFIAFSGALTFFGTELTIHLIPTTFPASGLSQAWLYGSLPLSSSIILIHSVNYALVNLCGIMGKEVKSQC